MSIKNKNKSQKLAIYQSKSGAIELRQDFDKETFWATKILKQHITKGFTINQSIINKNRQEFLKAVEDIKLLSWAFSHPNYINSRI